MRTLYLLSVWIHILAAAVWFGGMAFLVLVVVPWLKRSGAAGAGALLRDTGQRFRTVGWVCFALFLATGSFNLWVRGVRLADFTRPEWLASPFGGLVLSKLALFALTVLLSVIHDFRLGPRAARAIASDPSSAESRRLRRAASWLGRGNFLLAMLLIGVGVMIVRGLP